MAKAYWIAHVTVTDPERYAIYAKTATEAFTEFGAKVMARGGTSVALEGAEWPRNVVIEFSDLEAALACYRSAIYQQARTHRIGAATAELMIVEGVD